MTYKGNWPGTWAANCDVCGFRFPSSKLKKRWDGAITCDTDWETRHPQTLIKLRGETAVPAFTRKNPIVFADQCFIEGVSGYAGYAIAGCMVAGNNSLTPEQLASLLTNGHGT
jgi:hypothetical protein